MLTRLSEIQNKVVTTIVITILCFNALSNHEIYVHIFKYDETLRTRIYRLVAWGKEFMCSSDSYKLIIQKLNAVHWLIYFGNDISDHIFCCIDYSDNKEEML